MAFNFPDAPNVNDEYTAGDRTWVWDGTVWLDKGFTLGFDDLEPSVHASTHESGGTDELSLTASQISDVTATAAELNILDGVTADATELNLLDGVTATTTEINYLDGVTSGIQSQLDGKVDESDGSVTQATAGSAVVRNITLSTSEPTSGDGSDGDVWLVYTP